MIPPSPAEPVQYALASNGVAVIRVAGKATHLQSPSLRYIFEKTKRIAPPVRYVIDMEQCTTLDSTFMGTMASMGLHQRKTAGDPLVAANVQPHVAYLLKTLGLNFIMEVRERREAAAEGTPEAAFKPVNVPDLSATDRIVMMIEAHQTLVDADQSNELRFEGVLKSLRDSLDRAKQDPAG